MFVLVRGFESFQLLLVLFLVFGEVAFHF
jgi:hypothetical protein